MVTYYQVTAELYQEHVVPVLIAKQYDTGRGVDITLTDCGAVVVPSSTEQMRLYCKRPNGAVSYLAGTLSGNAVRVRFTNTVLSTEGLVECELQVGTGSTMVSTPVFNVMVLPSNYNASVPQSSNEFEALERALQTVNQYDSRITDVQNRATARGRLQSQSSVDVTLEEYHAYLVVGYGYGTNSVNTTHYSVSVVCTGDANATVAVFPVLTGGSQSMTVTPGVMSVTLATPSTIWSRYTVFRLG